MCTDPRWRDIDLVEDFPYEYMHLVCLGVTKKLLILWMRGKLENFRLSSGQVDIISQRLVSIRNYIPAEFTRKPRTLREVDRLKATEFRQFLLYTGPLVLHGILPNEHYKLFISLHVAIRILASESPETIY